MGLMENIYINPHLGRSMSPYMEYIYIFIYLIYIFMFNLYIDDICIICILFTMYHLYRLSMDIHTNINNHMEVSRNEGTPKSS